MGIILKLWFNGILMLFIVVFAQGQTEDNDISNSNSTSTSSSNSNSGSDSAAITTAAQTTAAVTTVAPAPLGPEQNEETSAEANGALPIAGGGAQQATTPQAAPQTAGGDANSAEDAGMSTTAVPPVMAANAAPGEVAPLDEDPTHRTEFIGTRTPDITTTIVASFVVAGNAALQEAESDNLTPQEMPGSRKVGIGVGVGVAAIAAVAMGAAAVYYFKQRAQ